MLHWVTCWFCRKLHHWGAKFKVILHEVPTGDSSTDPGSWMVDKNREKCKSKSQEVGWSFLSSLCVFFLPWNCLFFICVSFCSQTCPFCLIMLLLFLICLHVSFCVCFCVLFITLHVQLVLLRLLFVSLCIIVIYCVTLCSFMHSYLNLYKDMLMYNVSLFNLLITVGRINPYHCVNLIRNRPTPNLTFLCFFYNIWVKLITVNLQIKFISVLCENLSDPLCSPPSASLKQRWSLWSVFCLSAHKYHLVSKISHQLNSFLFFYYSSSLSHCDYFILIQLIFKLYLLVFTCCFCFFKA